MKKIRRFIFCFLLSCQAAVALFPVFRPHLNAKPPIHFQKPNPLDDIRETN